MSQGNKLQVTLDNLTVQKVFAHTLKWKVSILKSTYTFKSLELKMH